MKKVLAILLLGSVTLSSWATANHDEQTNPYFELSTVQIVKIAENDAPTNEILLEKSLTQEKFSGGEIGEVIAVADQIIAFGERVYKLIEKGRPVVRTSYAPISVLPKAARGQPAIEPFDLDNWQMPRSAKYKITYKNGFGMTVVSFTYNVNFAYGGKFNGVGAYITDAQIVPEDLLVQWGFTFEATSKLVGIVNHGSKANPNAGATLIISYSVDSVISSSKSNVSYHLTGRGGLTEI